MLIDLTVIISQCIGISNHHLKYILALLLSRVQLFVTPWTSPPGSSIHGNFPDKNTRGLPCPPPGALPNPGIEPRSSVLQADSLLSEPPGKP